MHNKDKPWYDDEINAGVHLTSSRRLIVGGPVICLGLINKEEFVRCQSES